MTKEFREHFFGVCIDCQLLGKIPEVCKGIKNANVCPKLCDMIEEGDLS